MSKSARGEQREFPRVVKYILPPKFSLQNGVRATREEMEAEVERRMFKVLYAKAGPKKRKTWFDGLLTYAQKKNKLSPPSVTLMDENYKLVEQATLKRNEIPITGEEMPLQEHLLQVLESEDNVRIQQKESATPQLVVSDTVTKQPRCGTLARVAPYAAPKTRGLCGLSKRPIYPVKTRFTCKSSLIAENTHGDFENAHTDVENVAHLPLQPDTHASIAESITSSIHKRSIRDVLNILSNYAAGPSQHPHVVDCLPAGEDIGLPDAKQGLQSDFCASGAGEQQVLHVPDVGLQPEFSKKSGLDEDDSSPDTCEEESGTQTSSAVAISMLLGDFSDDECGEEKVHKSTSSSCEPLCDTDLDAGISLLE